MRFSTIQKLENALKDLRSYSRDVYKEKHTKPTREDFEAYLLIETTQNALKNKKPNEQTGLWIKEFSDFLNKKVSTREMPSITGMDSTFTMIGSLTNKEIVNVAKLNEHFERQTRIEEGKKSFEKNYNFESGM